MNLYPLVKALLFKMDAEDAHHLTVDAMALLGQMPMAHFLCRRYFQPRHARSIRLWDLDFKNPVGLAAGFDKDARAWRGLSALGFSHIEVGTITPKAQVGNPRPRVFRLPENEAVINRLGFPSQGVEAAKSRLCQAKSNGLILGINIGKNKETPLEAASQDYLHLFHELHGLSDYMVVNISSPNTVGLRRLQARDHLESLLKSLADARQNQVDAGKRHVPILVKLAPDLQPAEIDDALGAILDTQMDGIIATNTTIQRPDSLVGPARAEMGGLSGRPLTPISTEIITQLWKKTDGKLPIVGVGGIMTIDDARRKLDAGATLIQVYTGMIYRGPRWITSLVEALV